MEQLINTKKILVRAPNWVGDVVMATPAFRCIRENYPDSYITLLIKRNLKGIINGSPWFDEVIEFEPIRQKGVNGQFNGSKIIFNNGIKDYLNLIKRIRHEKFDLGLLFPNSFSSAFTIRLGGVRRRIGYKRDARSFLLTDGLNRLRENGKFLPTYMVDFYLKLCTHLGCRVSSKKLELFITKECEDAGNELITKYNLDQKPFILINPGASYGTSKLWTTKGFAGTADLLRERVDCNVVLVCGPGEDNLVNEIENYAKNEVINLSRDKISLDTLKVLVRECILLITLDSGCRHYAVAIERPVVVLMGPNGPGYTDSEYEIGEVIREDIECSPCQLKVCPTDRRCMTMITSESVVKTCIDLLENQPVIKEVGRLSNPP